METDDTLKRHIQNAPKNARYTSKTNQNQLIEVISWRKWSTIAFSEVGGQHFNQRSSIMPTASQLTPPTRGTTAELRSAATDDAVTKRGRRKRGVPYGKRSVAATKSRSRRQATRVKDHRQATRRLRHARKWRSRSTFPPCFIDLVG